MKSRSSRMLVVMLAVLCIGATQAAGAKDSQGQATREVELLKNKIERTNDDIRALRTRIFVDLPKVMDGETQNVRRALDEFRADRSKVNRTKLQQTTIDALLRLVEATEPIVNQREDLQLRLTEIENKALERAASYRADAEKLDQNLPAQESELARHKAESTSLKERFMADPGNRELKRELRNRFHQENQLSWQIRSSELRARQKELASQRLHQKALDLQALHDGLADTFASLGFVQTRCRDNAAFLLEMAELEDEISAFGDRAELGELLTKVGELTKQTDDLNGGLDLAIDELLGPAPEGPGGPPELPETDFQRWLDQR